jgi:hypothetical protein
VKKRILVMLAVLATVAASASIAIAASQGTETERSVLMPAPDSTVTGTVHMKANAEGGTDIVIDASGLQPGARFASFYYDGHHCEFGEDLVARYTASPAGTAHVEGEADDPIDDIGSVSVRSPDYSVLFACAVF